MAAVSAPLAAHLLFRTDDRDHAEAEVGRVFCPHRLTATTGQRLAAVHNHARLGRMSLNYLTYGADVGIDPEPFGTFYLVQMPVYGAAAIGCPDGEFLSRRGRASVINPSDSLRMKWGGDCGQLILRLEREAVELFGAQLLGRPINREIRFSNMADAANPGAARLLRLLEFLAAEIGRPDAEEPGPILRVHLQQLVLAQLFEGLPHSHAQAVQLARGGAAPRHVRRAEDFIDAHAAEPISVHDIARAGGASLRALYDGFQHFRGTTPMEHLRQVRLHRVHEDLETAPRGATVSRIAAQWGFLHFGRFAGQYKSLFGESPSETLRRSGGRIGA